MTQPHDEPTLDDVLTPTEQTHPDHREHAKTPRPLDDDELRRRADAERAEADAGGPVRD